MEWRKGNTNMVEIFGTLGPACCERGLLKEMFRRGMDGMRLNLSHTTLADAADMLEAFRLAAEDAGKKPELLIDMQGPELRVSKPQAPVKLKEGETCILSCVSEGDLRIPAPVFEALETGDTVLIDDGRIECVCESKNESAVTVRVIRGGTVSERKSIKVTGKDIHGPVLTEDDLKNLREAEKYGVTAVMQPFVTKGKQLKEVRDVLHAYGLDDIRIFAKIESREGISLLDEIMPEADMIVIARGDLGNDMPLWELPKAQKCIEDRCIAAGKPFLVVTQMLASMTDSPVPTRAEVSDIFRAVYEGASAVMVTNETAVGKYPAEVIRYLKNTADSALEYIENR